MTWPEFDPSKLTPEKRAEIVFTAQTADESERLRAERASEGERLKAELAEQGERLKAELADAGERLKAGRATTDHATNADTDSHIAWATANRAADIDALAQFSTSLYTVASGSIDRARAGAELVQKASAAIAALYTGALALTFSVTNNPLPARGVLTPLFLGLAVVLSTAYIAYLGPRQGFSPGPKPALGLERKTFEWLNAFVALTHRIATARVGALRASVVALGVGLIFIAVPFVDLGSQVKTLDTLPANSPLSWATLEDSAAPEPVLAAQVEELTQLRATYLEPEPNTAVDLTILGLGALVGLLAVALLPRAFKRSELSQPPASRSGRGVGAAISESSSSRR